MIRVVSNAVDHTPREAHSAAVRVEQLNEVIYNPAGVVSPLQ